MDDTALPLPADWPFYLSIGAMLLGISGTLVTPGSLLQKTLFLISTPFLGIAAHAAGQKMLTALQIVISISAILAFLPVGLQARLLLLGGPALLAVGYLARIDYREEDAYWPVGGLGLLLLAAGLAISGTDPFLFNALLASGAAMVALYAGIGYVIQKIRIQAVWIVLNVLFAVNPLLRLAGTNVREIILATV